MQTSSQTLLLVSEHFYSIQGEGVTLGKPAVFLRLAACNLNCPGLSYQDPITHEHLGCDSKAVWRQGKRTTVTALLDHWEKNAWITALRNGAHLVITGGEPVIQQHKLGALFDALKGYGLDKLFIEIETNATLKLEPNIFSRLNQINASPKLTLSGETREDRYQPDVIRQYLNHPNVFFKFVVARLKDFEEIKRDYIDALNMPRANVLIMAEGGQRELLQSRAPWIIEACKHYGFRYTPRLHIDVWGEVTGI